MGIIADGDYRPNEDLFSKLASAATTIWSIPVPLAVVWGLYFVCDAVMSPRLSGIAYGLSLFLTFVGGLGFIGEWAYTIAKGVRRKERLDSAGITSSNFGFVLSLTPAVGAGGLPTIATSLASRVPVLSGPLAIAGLLLSFCWLATAAVFIGRHRSHGLRLLVGTPVALFWPFPWLVMMLGCTIGQGCV